MTIFFHGRVAVQTANAESALEVRNPHFTHSRAGRLHSSETEAAVFFSELAPMPFH